MRKSIALILALFATFLIGAAPVAASGTDPWLKCRYTAVQTSPDGWTEALLKRIDAMPPKMFALVGHQQKVGWRFKVARTIGDGERVITYRSPWQTAVATKDHAAPFTPMGVKVKFPTLPSGLDLTDLHYGAYLEIVWYNADGSNYAHGDGFGEGYKFYVDGRRIQWSSPDFDPCAGQIER